MSYSTDAIDRRPYLAGRLLLPDLGNLLVAALLLIIPALFNGFPIVTSDSGAYIANGFTLNVPLDRPLAYSIFIRITSLGFTLWGAVAAQAIILAFLLRMLCRHFLGAHYRNSIFLSIVFIVSLATSGAWFCSQLMPDIFTAILLLSVIVWYVLPLTAWWQKTSLLFFLFCVLVQHNSHPLILLIFAVVMMFVDRRRTKKLPGKSLTLLALSIAGLLCFSTMNAISGKGFKPSAASGVFLMCRLVESGVMDKFLAENCANNEYNLCQYRDKLPDRQWTFMWDENSPLTKTGGWTANEEEYKRIEWKILTTPKYLFLFLFKSLQGTIRQLPQIYLGDGNSAFGESSSPHNAVQAYFPYELKEYRSSVQNSGPFSLTLYNGIIVIATLLIIGTTLFVLPGRDENNRDWRFAFWLIFLFLICNAGITATFSTVLGRFEARVFWVLPFFCLLYLVNALLKYQARIKIHSLKQPIN